MVADLRHVVFSLFRIKIQQCEHAKTWQSLTFPYLWVFASSHFRDKRQKMQKDDKERKGENTTHFILYIVALHLSYICVFLGENANTQIDDKVKLVVPCVFAFSYFRIVLFSFFFIFRVLHLYKCMHTPIQSLSLTLPCMFVINLHMRNWNAKNENTTMGESENTTMRKSGTQQ